LASYPAAAVYGALYERDQTTGIAAARLGRALDRARLQRLGIDIDCLPLADRRSRALIGDRRSRLW
jgi:beta-N-acetylhexosaminidase